MTRVRPLPRLASYWGNSFPGLAIGTQRVDGKDFEVYGFDADIHRFLRDLAIHLRRYNFRPERLIRLRAVFRKITSRSSPIGLLFTFTTGDDVQRRLAAWLLGRMNWPRGVMFLQDCPRTAPLDLQFEIARALKRLRAWSELRILELQVQTYLQNSDCLSIAYREQMNRWMLRLKRMCNQHIATDHASRMANFLASGASVAHHFDPRQPRHQTLWYQEPLGPGKQAKSRWFIRRILERIRLAVRG